MNVPLAGTQETILNARARVHDSDATNESPGRPDTEDRICSLFPFASAQRRMVPGGTHTPLKQHTAAATSLLRTSMVTFDTNDLGVAFGLESSTAATWCETPRLSGKQSYVEFIACHAAERWPG